MRAITVSADARLELTELPDPSPGHGEVVLDVAAAGLNRADVLQRAGHYPPPPGASDIIGLEVSGTVRELGEGVTGWQVGDRVCALLAGGGYAEQVAVPAGQLLPVPAGLDLVDAAALPEAVCTAWSNLVDVAGLSAGQTVLVHGGSGGVGSAAIQLSRALGARVLTTAGGPGRAARCEELGADVVIDYHGDVPAAVHEATGGTGADVILDVLGAGGLADNVAMLATGGRLVVIGTQRGTRGEVDLMALMRKRASVHGTTLRARPLGEKAAIVTAVRERVWPMLHDGRLRAVVHDRLPLAQAERAHELLDSGEVFGKLLLVT
ncbi:putative NAD(P)H quinone oxidoreductase, PIG3 family [Georgenia satyanarayanai]|uniref:Putative NAD(P)H quinone oxidoreductase, PIG3 family n=1 Tax=Georgenia satyanarayanai TaxID=860221 RepID=A0A2Y9AM46_9MICO|nr:NAD(P)H-quinone oxidoreductase [Georgenia satyanarayanai]PYF97846.1 putative PIG3 family NAD(P)H quinone oxidoreductase [Georgenia satyanarayanai]SSA45420.1 putative NAD(P)H quinone oxidoreductase, PIG3 family [Georgenia satyanarayanai]